MISAHNYLALKHRNVDPSQPLRDLKHQPQFSMQHKRKEVRLIKNSQTKYQKLSGFSQKISIREKKQILENINLIIITSKTNFTIPKGPKEFLQALKTRFSRGRNITTHLGLMKTKNSNLRWNYYSKINDIDFKIKLKFLEYLFNIN